MLVPADTFLRDFYQSLADQALPPDDARYIPLYADPKLAPTDPVRELQTVIEWETLESAQLFSGFRGTGKSTELRRLKHQLERGGESIVILCDMQDYMNLTTPIDITDFLLGIAGALGDALQRDANLLGESLLTDGYWTRFHRFLTRTNVDLTEMELGSDAVVAGVTVKANLKADPSFKQRLQERMKGHLGALVVDVRAFVQECVKALQDRHGSNKRVVLLLDSVERLRGTVVNAPEVSASLVGLFQGHADKLRLPNTHVVYTVPPWLKIREPGITLLFDGAQWIPCVRVQRRDGSACPEGLNALARVVAERGDAVRLLGNREALDELILASGGYLRDLFRLLQACCRLGRGGALPVSASTREMAQHEVRNAYLPLSHEDVLWLDRIDRSCGTELEDGTRLPDLARYFDSLLVMTYRNGEEWWAVHPLISGAVRTQAEELRRRAAELRTAVEAPPA